ncbi:MAG: c-type cytochrome domain-containing protein [Limisphaerales bacterium]
MKRITIAIALCASLALVLPASAAAKKDIPPASKKTGLTFDKDIKPIFEKSCVECHGEKKQKGKLRLDTLANALKASENGKSITPGKGADSALVKAVARLVEDDAMPPEGKGKPLTNDQIGIIRAWIDQGAK